MSTTKTAAHASDTPRLRIGQRVIRTPKGLFHGSSAGEVTGVRGNEVRVMVPVKRENGYVQEDAWFNADNWTPDHPGTMGAQHGETSAANCLAESQRALWSGRLRVLSEIAEQQDSASLGWDPYGED